MVISYFIVSILINQLDLFSSPPSSPPTATIVSEFLVCFVCLYHYMICNLVLVVKMHNSLSYNFHVYCHTFLVSKSVWYNHYIKDYFKVYQSVAIVTIILKTFEKLFIDSNESNTTLMRYYYCSPLHMQVPLLHRVPRTTEPLIYHNVCPQ